MELSFFAAGLAGVAIIFTAVFSLQQKTIVRISQNLQPAYTSFSNATFSETFLPKPSFSEISDAETPLFTGDASEILPKSVSELSKYFSQTQPATAEKKPIPFSLASFTQPASLLQQSSDSVLSTSSYLFPTVSSSLSHEKSVDASIAGCAISLSMTPSIIPGDKNQYRIEIKNSGSLPCEQVMFTVYYEDGETFLNSSPAPRAGGYYWELGTLHPLTFAVISLVTSRKGTLAEIKNEACATSINDSDRCVQNTFSLEKYSRVPENQNSPSSVESAVIPESASVFNNLSALSPGPGAPNSEAASPDYKKSGREEIRGEFGTWVWNSPYSMTPEKQKTVIEQAAKHSVNTIYVTIDDTLAIARLPEGIEKENKKTLYFNALKNFISIADLNGIAVDAEAGWRDWAKPANRWKGKALLEFVNEYNKTYSPKLRGFQFDVEPYLLPEYEKNKASTLFDLVAFADEMTTIAKESGARISFVIPHFYDKLQKWTPPVSYKGKTAHAFTHLFNFTERIPGSSIILMAYRNFAEGENGVIEISQAEINEVSAAAGSTKIIIAQEVGDVEPNWVTYFGTSGALLFQEIKKTEEAFSLSNSFGGIAVHYLDPLVDLPE